MTMPIMVTVPNPPPERKPKGDARPQFTEEQLRAAINQAWEAAGLDPVPDPGTQIRELTHKLAETADDRDRLRAKCAELNRTNEQLSQEREAAEDAKRRMETTIADYEHLVESLGRERMELKASLYDYIIACGKLLPE